MPDVSNIQEILRVNQTLPDTVHAGRKQIDCLDYPVCRMEKQNKLL